MITNPSHLDEVVASFQQKENLSFEKKLALLDAMYRLARQFGQFSPERALEGIEHDIQLAARLNSLVRETTR
jgi:hypothetical protein